MSSVCITSGAGYSTQTMYNIKQTGHRPGISVADWTKAVIETSARAAVIGVVTAAELPAADALARALLAARPGLVVALGGPAALQVSARGGAIHLAASLPAAVESLQGALSR